VLSWKLYPLELDKQRWAGSLTEVVEISATMHIKAASVFAMDFSFCCISLTKLPRLSKSKFQVGLTQSQFDLANENGPGGYALTL